MNWNREISRRQLLGGAAAAGFGGVAYLAVGCSSETKPAASPSAVPSSQIDLAGAFLLSDLHRKISIEPGIWTSTVPASLWALSHVNRDQEVVFADGAGISDFLGSAPFGSADPWDVVQMLDQMVYIDLARGKIPSWKAREDQLGRALASGIADGKNAVLLRSLLLSQQLQQQGLGGQALIEQLSAKIRANAQADGWCTDTFGPTAAYRAPNVDTNALAVRTGLADQRLLDLGRFGPGWRHFVDPTVDPLAPKTSLASTISVGWVVGLSDQSHQWLLGLQRPDGSFRAYESQKRSEPAPTAEALAYLASAGHSVFGRSASNQSSTLLGWLFTTC